ncbi:hypothetical protein [Arthrobacter sp. B1I2]|uniref:hypothetical protein n=1 Tax=Arthrobacter sp. B1I2 TaxID=3042263 RepID=UPI0027D7C43E|nr:hypothetical protein [Arthrobacter sp. B1I2]
MTSTDQRPPENPSAWNWPAEWATERTFWREVAARTIAGVLSLVILAVPGLLYATIFGLLKPETGVPILIGITLFVVALVIYIVVLRRIRRKESGEIERVLAKDESRGESTPSPEEIMRSSPEARKRLLAAFSKVTQDGISQAEKIARDAHKRAALIGAGLGILVPVVVSLLVPFMPHR